MKIILMSSGARRRCRGGSDFRADETATQTRQTSIDEVDAGKRPFKNAASRDNPRKLRPTKSSPQLFDCLLRLPEMAALMRGDDRNAE